MRESVAKRIVREMFYKECVAAWLTLDEIREGSILTLLGEEPRELPYIDDIGFKRHQVKSVENDWDTFALQQQMMREEGWGVSLYSGEMVDYLKIMLHKHGRFVVLNMDIEGSYRNNLDPSMTSVVQFCCDNPRTVVGTYSTIGRSIHPVWEGIKGLSLLMWLVPDMVRKLLAAVSYGYSETDCTQSVRFTLRDVFWIASQLEHMTQASVVQGHIQRSGFDRFNEAYSSLWDFVMSHPHKTLRVKGLFDVVQWWRNEEPVLASHERLPKIPIRITKLMHVYYNARPPWSQRCFFCMYEVRENHAIAVQSVLSNLCRMFIDQRFTYVDRGGSRRDFDLACASTKSVHRFELWKGSRMYDSFQSRKLKPGVYRGD